MLLFGQGVSMTVHYPVARMSRCCSFRVRFAVWGTLLLVGVQHPYLWISEAAAAPKDPVSKAPFVQPEQSDTISPASLIQVRAVAWVPPRTPSQARWTESTGASQGSAATPSQETAAPKKQSKLKWILIAAAGAAAGGVFAFKGRSSSSDGPGVNMQPAGPNVTFGSPSVGAPQ
jgi:hypothetical protein